MARSGNDRASVPDDQFLHRLSLTDLEAGKLVDGDSGVSVTPPEDFDMAKFHRGRTFYREYLFSCSVAMFFSLVVGLSIPDFLDALILTNASDTPEKAFKRYMKTVHHVALWHYGNIWQKGSEAQKSILNVRKIHKKVREKLGAASKGQPQKFLSQYDMGVVQSGFMGAVIMYPDDFGIPCSLGDLDDYVYFWYGVGHALGIKHEYNICAHGLTQALVFSRQIWDDIVCKNIKNPPSQFEKMAHAVIRAFSDGRTFWTLLTLPVIIAVSPCIGKNEWQQLGVSDTIRYLILKLMFLAVKFCSWYRHFLGHKIEKLVDVTFTYV